MKTKDIAASYNLYQEEFEQFMTHSNCRQYYTEKMFGGGVVEDNAVEYCVQAYFDWKNEQIRNENEIRQAEEEKRQAMASMLITSGFNFDGYEIKKYSGYISGDDAIQIPRGTAGIFSNATDVGQSLMASLTQIRRNAINELKEAAYALGCNAVIGVDFDYITLEPETANFNGGTTYLPYVFGVTANGNAVIIEKKE